MPSDEGSEFELLTLNLPTEASKRSATVFGLRALFYSNQQHLLINNDRLWGVSGVRGVRGVSERVTVPTH